MTIYTNPTFDLTATPGDDTIIFTTPPASSFTVDALGGNDSLSVQFDSAVGARFDIYNDPITNSFAVGIYPNLFTPVSVLHVESVDLRGTSNDDNFSLLIGPNSSGLSVNMDGGAGQDHLSFNWSTSADLSFVVNGTTITSSFGTFSNFETFFVFGGSGNDTITTGSGNDAVSTGGGVDQVSTGAGDDAVDIASSGGTISLGDGNDSASLTAGASGFAGTIDGGIGQDQLNLAWSNMTGGQSFNALTSTSTVGTFVNFETFNIAGGAGTDTIITGAGDDNLYGFAGNDTISAGDGTNMVNGGDGNDIINTGIGVDTIYAGYGDDNISAGSGNDTIYGDEVFPSTSDGNDYIDGGDGNDLIYASGGNDTVVGGAGNDQLLGGMGSDHLDGGDGNDWLFSIDFANNLDGGERDVLLGGAGDDQIIAGYGDTVDGGAGFDLLSYIATDAGAGINVDFRQLTSGGTITIGGATLAGIEYVSGVSGTNFNDVIIAGAASGVTGVGINGEGGDDDLTGSAGVDWINGGDGNDVIHAGVGFDPSTSANRDTVYGDAGDDTIYSGPDGIQAYGGTGNDTLIGGAAADDLRGDSGDDVLTGGAGKDGLTGGTGNDTYIDTAANFNGDVIGDIDAGDKIIITDANINNFSFNLSGYVLTYTGGSLTFNSTVQGTLVASAAPGGGVQITLRTPPLGTIDQIAGQLTSGYWNGDTHRWAVTQGGTLTVNMSTLNAAEQTLARTALQEWTDIIGVRFQEVLSGGQILFDHSEGPNGAIAATDSIWSNGIISSAHVHISSSWVDFYGSSLNSYSFQTYVHEIGHALGLGHPGNYNFDGSYYADALFANDSWATSVMSYFDEQENTYFDNQNFSAIFALSPMQADIIAAQSLYGSSTATRAGNTVYGFNSNAGGIYDASAFSSAVAFTIYDSGGVDTLDYSLAGNAQIINLNPETFSSVNAGRGNLSIARGVVIENAIGGTGPDIIIGNSADNIITGNGSFDTLTGGAGNDTFKDTEAGFTNDTITDFSRGDRLVITDATLAGFTFLLSGNILTYTGGGMYLSNLRNASIAASAAPEGGVQITFSGPPIILSAGASVSPPAAAGASAQSAQAIALAPPNQLLDQPDFRDDRPSGWQAGIGHWEALHSSHADLFAFA